jgi:hypothetical protein
MVDFKPWESIAALDLAQREMRLLEIHPGDFDADLECTLLKSSLEITTKCIRHILTTGEMVPIEVSLL